MKFHVKYPAQRSIMTWDELGCLARSLGFREHLFSKSIPADVMTENPQGLTPKEVNRLMLYKHLDQAVDKSVNVHSADWNICVIRKAIKLLVHRIITFEELYNIRMAYQMYEGADCKGLSLDENTVLRCLKMCGLVIAPLKMHHRIKHMKLEFDEKDRMQLYEFLDLILWCEGHSKFVIPSVFNYNRTMDGDLYKLADFEQLMTHYDKRLHGHLDENYLKEEWDFGKEQYKKKKVSREPPVSSDFRVAQVRFHRNQYNSLKTDVSQSQLRLHTARAGHPPRHEGDTLEERRASSAPLLTRYERLTDKSTHTARSNQRHSHRPVTVGDLIKDYVHLTPQSAARENSDQEGKPLRSSLPSWSQSRRTRFMKKRLAVKPAVTLTDLKASRELIDDLAFEIQTLPLTYEHVIRRGLDRHIPKHAQRVGSAMSALSSSAALSPHRGLSSQQYSFQAFS